MAVPAARPISKGSAAAVRGAIALVRSNPMGSFDDLFAEYRRFARDDAVAAAAGAAAILFISTRPRDLLYRHTVTWGSLASLPLAQVAREDGLRLARLSNRTQAARARRSTSGIGSAGRGRPQRRRRDPGPQKPHEIVLLGAHLDAWDLGTGALDNGVNCALVMEVARAIAAGPRPARTVRFVLFTSEETGLLGSLGYVQKHRGELDRHVAGADPRHRRREDRRLLHQRPPELDAPVRAALAPVAAWGADTANPAAILGTDNFDFLLEGVPNLIANQETARYLADYHADSDTFDKVDLETRQPNAAIAAVAVLGIANAPSRLGPRQSRAQVQALLIANPNGSRRSR